MRSAPGLPHVRSRRKDTGHPVFHDPAHPGPAVHEPGHNEGEERQHTPGSQPVGNTAGPAEQAAHGEEDGDRQIGQAGQGLLPGGGRGKLHNGPAAAAEGVFNDTVPLPWRAVFPQGALRIALGDDTGDSGGNGFTHGWAPFYRPKRGDLRACADKTVI